MGVETVVSAKIHPAIGIARVGNSDEFILGPELPYPTTPPRGGYKDRHGKLKRQAARFRIYGYDASGRVVAELTAANATIAWTVHVANKKAAWYDFRFALDLFAPDSPRWLSETATRRNAGISGAERKKLAIDPGPHTVGGAKAKPAVLEGRFFGRPVYLGELRTDDAGRLLFLGGRGVSASIDEDKHPIAFANSPGWHDDTSDGPVRATVRIGKKTIPVDSAWVVTAPPNYAPDIVSPQTMYDVVYDTGAGTWFNDIGKPSFTKNILPLFQQLSDTQWVNYGFFVRHGWQAPYDFNDETLLRKLATPKTKAGDPYAELRREIFYQFRQPGSPSSQEPPFRWPPIYGDAEGSFQDESRAMFTYTKTILNYLAAWRDGNFEADYDPAKADDRPQRFSDVALQAQPEVLDRSALHWCMGGPFHPGCEMTWIVRQPMMYRSAWRLRERPPGVPEPDHGETITPAEMLGDTGPLASSGPGDITKWMAVPWQTDTASCQSGYEAGDAYLPSFWPSRVPNHVLAHEDYERVVDTSLPMAQRVAAFNTRLNWLRNLNLQAPFVEQISKMIGSFGELGVVERRANPNPRDPFPKTFFVESPPGIELPPDQKAAARHARGGEGVNPEFLRIRFGGRARTF